MLNTTFKYISARFWQPKAPYIFSIIMLTIIRLIMLTVIQINKLLTDLNHGYVPKVPQLTRFHFL